MKVREFNQRKSPQFPILVSNQNQKAEGIFIFLCVASIIDGISYHLSHIWLTVSTWEF